MKLRLKDNSFRFRITSAELVHLERTGSINCQARYPGPQGSVQTFSYAVKIVPELSGGRIVLETHCISLLLSAGELEELKRPDLEGVYLREEWTDPRDATHRAMAFIEKDRLATRCERPESWVYGSKSQRGETGKTDSRQA